MGAPAAIAGMSTADVGLVKRRATISQSNRKKSDLADSLQTRREILRQGAKLAYVAPIVLALSSQKAFATGSNPIWVALGDVNSDLKLDILLTHLEGESNTLYVNSGNIGYQGTTIST